jgi:hypothetical protein
MEIFLLMAAAAIHHTGARGGFVAFILHHCMTLLAGGLFFFFSVDRGVKFIDGDMKFAFGTAYLVAIDAVLGCIGQGGLNRNK